MHIGLVSRLSVPMPMSIRMPTNKCMRGMSMQVRHLKQIEIQCRAQVLHKSLQLSGIH